MHKYLHLQIDTDINKGKMYAEYRKESKQKVQDNKANRIARLKMEKAERDRKRGRTIISQVARRSTDFDK